MNNFIYQIYYFIRTIFNELYDIILNVGAVNGIYTTNTIAKESYINFMAKNVFTTSSYIGINITWGELFIFLSTIFLIIFFIVLIVRFIWSLLTIIKDSATKWR